MSHPDTTHDRSNERSDDSKFAPKKGHSPKSKALSHKIDGKAFGQDYNRKSLKRMMKKSINYRLKHF